MCNPCIGAMQEAVDLKADAERFLGLDEMAIKKYEYKYKYTQK